MVDAEDALSLGLRAYSNALVVGGQLEQLIRAMRDSAGATFSDFHLIGQSLGAHAVGYAGKKARENGELIGRITGMGDDKKYVSFSYNVWSEHSVFIYVIQPLQVLNAFSYIWRLHNNISKDNISLLQFWPRGMDDIHIFNTEPISNS